MPKNLHSSKPKKSRMRYSASAKRDDHQAKRMERTKKYGHCKSRRYGTNLTEPQVREDVRLYSFEDEYKTYRRTRGRRDVSIAPASTAISRSSARRTTS